MKLMKKAVSLLLAVMIAVPAFFIAAPAQKVEAATTSTSYFAATNKVLDGKFCGDKFGSYYVYGEYISGGGYYLKCGTSLAKAKTIVTIPKGSSLSDKFVSNGRYLYYTVTSNINGVKYGTVYKIKMDGTGNTKIFRKRNVVSVDGCYGNRLCYSTYVNYKYYMYRYNLKKKTTAKVFGDFRATSSYGRYIVGTRGSYMYSYNAYNGKRNKIRAGENPVITSTKKIYYLSSEMIAGRFYETPYSCSFTGGSRVKLYSGILYPYPSIIARSGMYGAFSSSNYRKLDYTRKALVNTWK